MTSYDDWYSDMGGAPVIQMRTMAGVQFRQEKRVQESITAGVERSVLHWLAMRLPAWVNSDHLTALGSFGMLLAGASYACARWHRWGLLTAIFFSP
jgi:hypothetical protein